MATRSYRLVVEGELGSRYSSAFAGMTLSAHDGTTEIVGPVVDPAHLQGMLEQIAGLGLTLHSVTALAAGDAGGRVHDREGVQTQLSRPTEPREPGADTGSAAHR